MIVSSRRLLAWLLLVALPWQGVAAAAMVLCGPGTQAAVHGVLEAHAPAADGHGMHHGHGAHDALQSHDAGHAESGHGLQADADHHCAACSVCGHALALPGAPVMLQTPPLPQGPVAGVWQRPASRVAPLPDKPPRA